MSRRRIATAILLNAFLCVGAVWCGTFMNSKRDAARSANADLAACKKAAEKICACRKRPALAADQERLAAETTGAIEAAAKAAGIDMRQLVRITPGAAQRIEESAYKEKPTHILLKSVDLRQLTAMLHAMETGPQRLHTRSVRFAAPQRNDTGGEWTAEVVVSYLIYDPPTVEKVRVIR